MSGRNHTPPSRLHEKYQEPFSSVHGSERAYPSVTGQRIPQSRAGSATSLPSCRRNPQRSKSHRYRRILRGRRRSAPPSKPRSAARVPSSSARPRTSPPFQTKEESRDAGSSNWPLPGNLRADYKVRSTQARTSRTIGQAKTPHECSPRSSDGPCRRTGCQPRCR